MSWSGLNNFELQALRKLLCLDVSEAAELIGKVSNRTWQYWEAGRNNIPDDIDMEMYALTQWRNNLIDNTLEEFGLLGDIGVIRWYHTFESFIVDHPSSNKLFWRLHQSTLAYLFAEGGEVELSADAPLKKDGYIYKWFNGITEEQIESKRQNDEFDQLLKKKNKK
jgi:hypothetical protein